MTIKASYLSQTSLSLIVLCLTLCPLVFLDKVLLCGQVGISPLSSASRVLGLETSTTMLRVHSLCFSLSGGEPPTPHAVLLQAVA